jgi:type I restriction enzyme S subunit
MENKKEKLVPELRFPEFKGEWKNSKLGNIAEFDKGKNISKADISEDGEIECIRYGELYTRYKEIIDEVYSRTNLDKEELVFSEKGDVLTPSSGETAIDIATASCINKDDVALGGDINIIRSDINGNFLAYYLSNKKRTDVARLAQGISVIHLYKSHLKSLSVNLPSKQEQQKISSFLSLIDKKIELLKKKKELLELYKKGVMQKIFNREIRFKDKDGNDYPEWEEKRLGEIAKVNKGEQKNRSELREEFEYPVINGGQEPSGFIDTFNTPKNTITISEGGNSCGFVNFITKNFWSGGHCYTLEGLKKSINQYYLYSYLKYNEKKIMRLRVGSGLPNIQEGDIQKFKVVVPSLEEQLDIKKLLKAINKSIEFVSFNLENTKVFKKGLLQKMFI